MILVMKIDRGHVIKGLMRSLEVVLNEPLGYIVIEPLTVHGEISQLDELFPQSAIESLIHRIVGWCSGTNEVVRKLQVFSRMMRMFTRIHSGKRDLGVDINAGKHIALLAGVIDGETIKYYKESVPLFFLQFRNALLGLIQASLPSQLLRSLRVEVQSMFFNHSLYFPRRNGCPPYASSPNLLLVVADVALAQSKDTQLLFPGYHPLADTVWSATQFFQRLKPMGIVSFLPVTARSC